MAVQSNPDQLVGILRDTVVALVRRDGPDLSARQLGVFLTVIRFSLAVMSAAPCTTWPPVGNCARAGRLAPNAAATAAAIACRAKRTRREAPAEAR